jgi:tellurite resistance protein TehA-like permease
MSGLFIVLFAYWFFFITTIAIIAGIRKMTFSLNWWAFIFPNAGLTLATIQVGKVLKSEAINGVAGHHVAHNISLLHSRSLAGRCHVAWKR